MGSAFVVSSHLRDITVAEVAVPGLRLGKQPLQQRGLRLSKRRQSTDNRSRNSVWRFCKGRPLYCRAIWIQRLAFG